MVRRHGWRSGLLLWALGEIGKPFVWGTTDCGALARRALIEMFGEELAPFLPCWNSIRGAAVILQVRESMGRILEELGADTTTSSFIRAGDLIISAEPEEKIGHESAMVCVDGQRCLASTRDGVVFAKAPQEGVVYSLWEVALG